MNSRKYRSQFSRFLLERTDFACWQEAALFREFQPEQRFVSFFQDASDFIGPVSFAACAASGAITRRDRISTDRPDRRSC